METRITTGISTHSYTEEFLLRVINAWEGRVEQLIGRRGFFTCLELYADFSYLLSGRFYERGFPFQFMRGGAFKVTSANTRDGSPTPPDIEEPSAHVSLGMMEG